MATKDEIQAQNLRLERALSRLILVVKQKPIKSLAGYSDILAWERRLSTEKDAAEAVLYSEDEPNKPRQA